MPNQFTHPWTDTEILYLKENFAKKTYKDIGKFLNRTYSSVQSRVRNLKINKRVCKHTINSDFFNIFSNEMAYVLGFITADGNIYKSKNGYNIQIACDDKDIIDKIKLLLNSSSNIGAKLRNNGKISYSLRFSDKHMYYDLLYYDLLKLGITPNKSLTITPPIIPKKYLSDYLRGFLVEMVV